MKHLLPALCLVLSGCVTLDSPGHGMPDEIVNPCLQVPSAGAHPFVSASLLSPYIGNPESDSQALSLTGGVLWQPDLSPDWVFGFFGAAQGRAAFSTVTLDDSSNLPADQKALFGHTDSDLILEARGKAGIQTKFYIGTLAVYGMATAQDESGAYFDRRKSVDGVDEFYNVSANPVTLALGWGADLSFGSAKSWDVGLVLETSSYHTKTQTYTGTDDNLHPTVSPGGTTWISGNVQVGIYLDIAQTRLSVEAGEGPHPSVNLAYRW